MRDACAARGAVDVTYLLLRIPNGRELTEQAELGVGIQDVPPLEETAAQFAVGVVSAGAVVEIFFALRDETELVLAARVLQACVPFGITLREVGVLQRQVIVEVRASDDAKCVAQGRRERKTCAYVHDRAAKFLRIPSQRKDQAAESGCRDLVAIRCIVDVAIEAQTRLYVARKRCAVGAVVAADEGEIFFELTFDITRWILRLQDFEFAPRSIGLVGLHERATEFGTRRTMLGILVDDAL